MSWLATPKSMHNKIFNAEGYGYEEIGSKIGRKLTMGSQTHAKTRLVRQEKLQEAISGRRICLVYLGGRKK